MNFENFDLKPELVPLFFQGVFSEYELQYKIQNNTKKFREEVRKTHNKKECRDKTIKEIEELLKNCIHDLWIINDKYKELYHKTEYWEKKSTYDFDHENWNKVKKVNGKLTRYIKELIEVERSLRNENN